ncbi:flagellar hook protein [Nocardioides sp. MAH-18]|uniref:Flagellin n=1 Tax=Nocardioides agri TaxID=2682843 RepID=A0A6L6XV70_9ACTN|nr:MULTISPECIES: flagellin [unclassified Nocardioides]MBA2955793.1 flagellar hook protein [Nocardioides sp. CGMCC 1.13656]MVQ50643.1 flagellar hook protein [Nocardioides sp. MAH-18]
MTLVRVTQNMLGKQSYAGLQVSMNRLATSQEQLTTGRLINRPSDNPTGATTAMRIRADLADKQQHLRNASDAQGWLDQIDTTLGTMTDQVRRARELAMSANSGIMSPESREALAVEVDQIRQGLIAGANTTYLDRPVFGGVTAGTTAYDGAGAFVGQSSPTGVVRTVAEGAKVRVDVEGPAVFGDDTAADSMFDHLAALSTALRTANQAGIDAAATALDVDFKRIVNVRADVGARANRVENARTVAADGELTLRNGLSEVENVDLAKATVDLKLQEVAYQAALGATARVVRPSLLDFLR